MKKKRGIFAGRQQTPPAIPPTQISDAKLLADLDVEIAAAERAANPPEGSTAVINALSPGLAAMMPTPGRARHQVRRPVDPVTGQYICEVTGWMPLPDPPEEVTNNAV